MKWTEQVRHGLSLPWASKWLMVETLLALVWFTVHVRWLPFQRLASRWGTPGQVANMVLDERQKRVAREVAWLIEAVGRRLPFETTCLMRTAAAQCLLARRGVATTVYLGVAPSLSDGRQVNAHAWLRCGDRIVTGQSEASKFRPIAWFS